MTLIHSCCLFVLVFAGPDTKSFPSKCNLCCFLCNLIDMCQGQKVSESSPIGLTGDTGRRCAYRFMRPGISKWHGLVAKWRDCIGSNGVFSFK